MVSSNILSLDEVTEDNSTVSTTPHNHQPQTRDDLNNPIVTMMNEPTLATDTESTFSHSNPATITTTEVPSSFDTTIPDEIVNQNTINITYSDNDNTYMRPRSSSTISSSEESDCDTTCENFENFNTIERCPKDENNSLPLPEQLPKSLVMSNDVLISHSAPVIVPQMATVPSRPFKSNRPTPKAGGIQTAIKNITQVSQEETKPTVRLLLLCQPQSHQYQTRNIVLEPNQEVKVGRSITRNRESENNAIFDCKVLSRNHAVIWMENGKFYIRDTASSNGTFVNEYRLSLTANPSKPYEIKTGDIVQFGVDVLENSYAEKHGCIIAMLKFCTGNVDADDLKRASTINAVEDPRFAKLSNQWNGRNLSSAELYRLNTFIQEAVQREQILENKLLSLQKIIDQTRKNSANVWQSMIEEDRLLSRIDILENKLQYFQKNFTDDKLRKEIIKLQDDKSVYQNSAKEALRKVYDDRNEAVMKLSTIERALCSSEDECALLRNQLLKTQQNFKEVTVSLTQLEERDARQQTQEQLYAQHQALSDAKMRELYEQINLRNVECMKSRSALDKVTKEKTDLLERIEMYEKLSERIHEAEDDDEEEEVVGVSEMTNNPVMQLLDKMYIKEGEQHRKKATNEFPNLNVKLGNIEKNLTLLDEVQLKIKFDTNTVKDSDDNQAPTYNDKPAEDDGKSAINQPNIMQDTVEDLKVIYSELKSCLLQTDDSLNPKASVLESELSRCKQELTDLQRDLQTRPTIDDLSDKNKECDELRRQVMELATTTEYLHMQLNKPSIVPSPQCVDTHVQTDTSLMPQPTPECSTSSSNAYVQTEASTELNVSQTPNGNGIHPVNEEVELVVKVVHTQSPLNAEEVTILSPSTEYADDIALLIDPNVQRETELITIKEQCLKLTTENQQLSIRLSQVSGRSDTISNNSTIMWIMAILILIIACLLGILLF